MMNAEQEKHHGLHPLNPARGGMEAKIDLKLPTDLASVEAEIEKSAGALALQSPFRKGSTRLGGGGILQKRKTAAAAKSPAPPLRKGECSSCNIATFAALPSQGSASNDQ